MSNNLSDLDRRTIGNLSNPRNVPELSHALRIDPYTPTRSDEEVQNHLQELAKRGLVVNLGETEDFSKLISHLPKKAMAVHDDTAKTYSEILSQPRNEWRASGDHWILSAEGLDLLQDQSDAPPPMTVSEVQRAIDNEWARTKKDLNADDVTPDHKVELANALLCDEFLTWAKAVADACEKTWNERPVLPLGGGAGWSDLYSRLILDHENQKTALPALAAPWYMALCTTAPTDATAYGSLVEAAYTGYARKSVAAADMAAASSGPATSSNVNAITFAACTAGTSNVIAFANVADASGSATTAGFRKWGTCTSTTVSTTQTPATFAVSAYTTTAD